MNKCWRSSVQDTRTYRRADVGSDHYRLKSTLKLKLKRQQRQEMEKPYAIEKLKLDDTVSEFEVQLSNRFQLLQDANGIEERWMMFKEALTKSAEETLVKIRGSQRERWIHDRTWTLIDKRKLAKMLHEQAKTLDEQREMSDKYKTRDRQVKSSCKADKRAWLDHERSEAEEAAKRNDSKTLYRIV